METFVYALTPLDHGKVPKNEIQPAVMNSDLLSREVDSISLLLSLLVSLQDVNSDSIDLLPFHVSCFAIANLVH